MYCPTLDPEVVDGDDVGWFRAATARASRSRRQNALQIPGWNLHRHADAVVIPRYKLFCQTTRGLHESEGSPMMGDNSVSLNISSMSAN
jgi:hypothetical protein